MFLLLLGIYICWWNRDILIRFLVEKTEGSVIHSYSQTHFLTLIHHQTPLKDKITYVYTIMRHKRRRNFMHEEESKENFKYAIVLPDKDIEHFIWVRKFYLPTLSWTRSPFAEETSALRLQLKPVHENLIKRLLIYVSHFLGYKTRFSFQTNYKDLDPSCKTI